MTNLVWNVDTHADPSSMDNALRAHRRDRHGRQQRGPLLVPTVPGWRSYRDKFDSAAAATLRALSQHFTPAQRVELGVEDVPSSELAPWEYGGVRLARCFDEDRTCGLRPRIVVYRLPIMGRCSAEDGLEELLHTVLVDALAHLFAVNPKDIDPDF